MTDRRKFWLVVLLFASTVIAMLALERVWFADREFDAAVWRDEAQVRRGVRSKMADWLLARGMLLGKTRAEVVELLGEPPPTEYFADWDMVYWLGLERGYGIDSEWLVLRVDSEGRIAENHIARD